MKPKQGKCKVNQCLWFFLYALFPMEFSFRCISRKIVWTGQWKYADFCLKGAFTTTRDLLIQQTAWAQLDKQGELWKRSNKRGTQGSSPPPMPSCQLAGWSVTHNNTRAEEHLLLQSKGRHKREKSHREPVFDFVKYAVRSIQSLRFCQAIFPWHKYAATTATTKRERYYDRGGCICYCLSKSKNRW